MSRIFISHSSKNNAAALALASWLKSQGWDDCFLDISEHRGIAPGERWMAALAGAVDRCEAVIFLVSPAWRDSKYCFAEFYQAKNLGKRIFGVIVEPIALSQLPEQLTAEWQVCDLTHTQDPVAFTVERVPLVPQTVVHFPAFGLDALARGLHKAGLDPSYFKWPPDADPERSPYPGLRALDEADAAVFFGREASIVRAIDQIRQIRERDVERLFVILGASGAGKSSFLRAGLLPRLRRDSDHFVVLPPIRPERAAISGSHGLLAGLASALARAGQTLSLAEVRSALTDTGLVGVLRRIATKPTPQGAHDPGDAQPVKPNRTVIVPIDQAEELFANDAGAEAQQLLQWVGALWHSLMAPEKSPVGERLRVLFVITIRSDSLPRMQADATLQRLSPVLYSLPAMPASEFKAVIEGPARRHTETVKPLVVAPQLTEKLMADAKGADALPLLALTLEWLYREFTTGQGTRLELDEYISLGGIKGVIDKAVGRALEQPSRTPAIPAESAEQERLLVQVFPFLATVDPDSGEWKRRVALRAVLREAAPQGDALVERLIEQRLLVTDVRQTSEAIEPAEVVEVAHEALLRQWGAMERWLRAFAVDLAAVESVRRAAQDWQRGQGDDVLLVHTAHRLQAAEALLANDLFKRRFEALDEQYLKSCRERDRLELQAREAQLQQMAEQQARLSEQQAKRAALQRRASWGLLLLLVALLSLVGLNMQQSREVGRQTSLVYASAAEAASDRNEAGRGVRLAILANNSKWMHSTDATAHPALATAVDSNTLRISLFGHEGPVSTASFSVDGKYVLTTSQDGTARVWDAETGKPLSAPMAHSNGGLSARLSSDGKYVLTDTTAFVGTLGLLHQISSTRVWEAKTGQPMSTPMEHEKTVTDASFSPDGRRVVTASADMIARVWDAETGKRLGAPMEHEDRVNGASFSPDGRRVVTASDDKIARVWDAETGKRLGAPMKHEYAVNSARFSPDGKYVLTTSGDTTALVWDAETGKLLSANMTDWDELISASFSLDSKRIITLSGSKTARVWEAETGKPLSAPMVHEDLVLSASFSPDGKYILTASRDKTARVWEAETGEPLSVAMVHEDVVWSASFSSDGKRVVTAANKTARVWEAKTGKPMGLAMTHEDNVWDATFSPDDKRVVTASEGKIAHIWDVETGKTLTLPMAYQEVSTNRVRSHSKSVVEDWEKAYVVDDETRSTIGPITHEKEGWISSASVSPNGRRVVTVSRTARVWESETGRSLGLPIEHDDEIENASFSPDSERVVTASADKTARVWDAETGKAVSAPMTHEDAVNLASFSHDGKRVVTVSGGDTARVWDVKTGKPLSARMTHELPVSSATFSPDGNSLVTRLEDESVRVWNVQWSTFDNTDALMRAACARMNPAARRITLQDRRQVPLIPPELLGKDVCEIAETMPTR